MTVQISYDHAVKLQCCIKIGKSKKIILFGTLWAIDLYMFSLKNKCLLRTVPSLIHIHHNCQPFRFWRNSSAFYTIFRHFDRNDQIPPKFKKIDNANTMDKDYAFARLCIREIYFNVLFHAAASLHLFLAAACNGAYDWLACGCWPMSSLETNVLLLFLLDAGEYNF